MRVLLTGCSGYIGSRLIDPLQTLGHTVIGVDRNKPTVCEPDDFIQGDLMGRSLVRTALKGIDVVMHLSAAKDDWGVSDQAYFRENLNVTRVLVEEGQKTDIKDWLFYSTVAVLGPSEIPLGETAPLRPTIAYGASKAEAELLFQQWGERDPDLRVVIIRPSVVFGPDNPASTNVYRLIDAVYRNRFVMIGDGGAVKTTSYIENLIAANLFLMDRFDNGVKTFIYVDEPVLSTADLVQKVCKLLDKRPPALRLPLPVAKHIALVSDVVGKLVQVDFPITAARIQKFCTGTNFDSSAIRRLGFEQPVSMDLALEKTVEWHLGSYNGRRHLAQEIRSRV